ncbi:hypothetical protein D3P09_21370 [Paenibacillus pinisoli]|uniref:F5/8 type C domain-containing protein n=1 Tax=Paenibacillus pinisoli TaxID=1276110 RepID=A0A3A6PBH4_9BACL|nr:discoidin domain-containing protein [Paenibacillus pinisoli]RJX37535.1 hypothetical protein D3P09_21370 [Paenibacillus pinisoli]
MENVFKNPSLNYLSCRKIQLYNHLLQNGISIEYFYYNALESSDNVFTEIIINRKRKWTFSSNLPNSWEACGIAAYFLPFEKLINVKEILNDLLIHHTSVFIWVDNKHVSHNLNLDPNLNHSLQIVSSIDDHTYLIDDIPTIQGISYNFHEIELCCDNAKPHKKYLYYLDFHNYEINTEVVSRFEELLVRFIHSYEDKLSFYDYLVDFFSSEDAIESRLDELFPYLDDAFSIIAGSRHLFAKSLEAFEINKLYPQLYIEISKRVEGLKLSLAKANLKGEISRQHFVHQVCRIKTMEFDAINILKNGDDHLLKINSYQLQKVRPKPILLGSSDSTLKIGWEEQLDNVWSNSYEVFKNGALVGTTASRYFVIKGVEPKNTYEIAVKAKDIFGHKSELSEALHVYFDPQENNNLALFKEVFSSSDENTFFCKESIVDGKLDTRWSSNADEAIAWICIDFNKVIIFSKIILHWEAAYAKKYRLQTSYDSSNWVEIYSNGEGVGGKVTINVHGEGKYLRIYCEEKGTPFGYSLWNISVFK